MSICYGGQQQIRHFRKHNHISQMICAVFCTSGPPSKYESLSVSKAPMAKICQRLRICCVAKSNRNLKLITPSNRMFLLSFTTLSATVTAGKEHGIMVCTPPLTRSCCLFLFLYVPLHPAEEDLFVCKSMSANICS